MNVVNLFSHPMHHFEVATAYLLSELNIKFTRTHLQKELIEHPDYPTLAALVDVIGVSYDVACAPIKISIEEYINSPDFRLPFIAQLRPETFTHDIFAVVTNVKDDNIYLYNPVNKIKENYKIIEFRELYKGVILIVESGEKEEEDNYETNLKKEKQTSFFNTLALGIFPIITLLIGTIYLANQSSIQAIAVFVFLLLLLAGVYITLLLLWHDIDEYNPVIRQVCKVSQKKNCSAVLHSKASKIIGINWSNLGFIYFAGILLSLLITGISQSSLLLSAWLCLPSLCYPIFSIYYQWKVLKQWCLLCLSVQAILLLLPLTAFMGGFYNVPIDANLSVAIGYFISFSFVFAALYLIMPALQKARSNREKIIELQRLKHNPLIFEGVLAKQKEIARPPVNLGITLGNSDSRYKLIKVCNPYCGPCAKAHPIMEEILFNNDEMSLQIIFTASDQENDIKRQPALHLMAIAAKGIESITQQALDDWYLADRKDYNIFAAKYPMNGELKEQMNRIKEMKEWCNETEIYFTPTFFISISNNAKQPKFYQLPEMYTVADLKYFFTT